MSSYVSEEKSKEKIPVAGWCIKAEHEKKVSESVTAPPRARSAVALPCSGGTLKADSIS